MTTAMVLSLLKYTPGPALVWFLRWAAPKWIEKHVPSFWQPIAAAAVNVGIALASGVDPVLSVSALFDALNTAMQTGGVVKTLDYLQGKWRVVSEKDKALLEKAKVGEACKVSDPLPDPMSSMNPNE